MEEEWGGGFGFDGGLIGTRGVRVGGLGAWFGFWTCVRVYRAEIPLSSRFGRAG